MTDMTINIVPNIFQKNGFIVEKIGNGFLVRNYLSEEKQIEYYQHIIQVSKNSEEHKQIIDQPTNRAFPICMWNNVYTGTSNCARPEKMLELGNKIIMEFPDFTELKCINSVYAQLFGADATMSAHCDEHVDWGISINLGASVLFTFGTNKDRFNGVPNYVVLNSGDIFLGDFSSNLHSIDAVLNNTPNWFISDYVFNRTRCSIQLRDLTNVTNKKISDIQFKNMLKSY